MIGANRAAYFLVCACILFTLFSLPFSTAAQQRVNAANCSATCKVEAGCTVPGKGLVAQGKMLYTGAACVDSGKEGKCNDKGKCVLNQTPEEAAKALKDGVQGGTSGDVKTLQPTGNFDPGGLTGEVPKSQPASDFWSLQNIQKAFGVSPVGTDPFDAEPKGPILERLFGSWFSPSTSVTPAAEGYINGSESLGAPSAPASTLQPKGEPLYFDPATQQYVYPGGSYDQNPDGTFGPPTPSFRETEISSMEKLREYAVAGEEWAKESLRTFAMAGERWAREAWENLYGLQPLARTTEELNRSLEDGSAAYNAMQNRVQELKNSPPSTTKMDEYIDNLRADREKGVENLKKIEANLKKAYAEEKKLEQWKKKGKTLVQYTDGTTKSIDEALKGTRDYIASAEASYERIDTSITNIDQRMGDAEMARATYLEDSQTRFAQMANLPPEQLSEVLSNNAAGQRLAEFVGVTDINNAQLEASAAIGASDPKELEAYSKRLNEATVAKNLLGTIPARLEAFSTDSDVQAFERAGLAKDAQDRVKDLTAELKQAESDFKKLGAGNPGGSAGDEWTKARAEASARISQAAIDLKQAQVEAARLKDVAEGFKLEAREYYALKNTPYDPGGLMSQEQADQNAKRLAAIQKDFEGSGNGYISESMQAKLDKAVAIRKQYDTEISRATSPLNRLLVSGNEINDAIRHAAELQKDMANVLGSDNVQAAQKYSSYNPLGWGAAGRNWWDENISHKLPTLVDTSSWSPAAATFLGPLANPHQTIAALPGWAVGVVPDVVGGILYLTPGIGSSFGLSSNEAMNAGTLSASEAATHTLVNGVFGFYFGKGLLRGEAPAARSELTEASGAALRTATYDPATGAIRSGEPLARVAESVGEPLIAESARGGEPLRVAEAPAGEAPRSGVGEPPAGAPRSEVTRGSAEPVRGSGEAPASQSGPREQLQNYVRDAGQAIRETATARAADLPAARGLETGGPFATRLAEPLASRPVGESAPRLTTNGPFAMESPARIAERADLARQAEEKFAAMQKEAENYQRAVEKAAENPANRVPDVDGLYSVKNVDPIADANFKKAVQEWRDAEAALGEKAPPLSEVIPYETPRLEVFDVKDLGGGRVEFSVRLAEETASRGATARALEDAANAARSDLAAARDAVENSSLRAEEKAEVQRALDSIEQKANANPPLREEVALKAADFADIQKALDNYMKNPAERAALQRPLDTLSQRLAEVDQARASSELARAGEASKTKEPLPGMMKLGGPKGEPAAAKTTEAAPKPAAAKAGEAPKAAAGERAPPQRTALQAARDAGRNVADRIGQLFSRAEAPRQAAISTKTASNAPLSPTRVQELLDKTQATAKSNGVTLKQSQIDGTKVTAIDGNHAVIITGEGKSNVAAAWAEVRRNIVGSDKPLELNTPTLEQSIKYENELGKIFKDGGNNIVNLSKINAEQGLEAAANAVKNEPPNTLRIADRETRRFLDDRAITDKQLRDKLAESDMIVDEVDAMVTDPSEAIMSSKTGRATLDQLDRTQVDQVKNALQFEMDAGTGKPAYRALDKDTPVERVATADQWNAKVDDIARSSKKEMLILDDGSGVSHVEMSAALKMELESKGISTAKNSPDAGAIMETIRVLEENKGAPNTHVIGDVSSNLNAGKVEKGVIPISAAQEGKVSQVPSLRVQRATALREGLSLEESAAISRVTHATAAKPMSSLGADNIRAGNQVVGMTGTDGGGGLATKINLGREIVEVKGESYTQMLSRVLDQPIDGTVGPPKADARILPSWDKFQEVVANGREKNTLMLTRDPKVLNDLKADLAEGKYGGDPAKTVTKDFSQGTTLDGKPTARTVDDIVNKAGGSADYRAAGALDMTKATNFQGEWRNGISADMPKSDFQQAVGRGERVNPATRERWPGETYVIDAPEARLNRLSDAMQNPLGTRDALQKIGGDRAVELFDRARASDKSYEALSAREKIELHQELLEVDKQGVSLSGQASRALDAELTRGQYEGFIGDEGVSPWVKDIAQKRYEDAINNHSVSADFSGGKIEPVQHAGDKALQNSLEASRNVSRRELEGFRKEIQDSVARGEKLSGRDQALLDQWDAKLAEAEAIRNVRDVGVVEKALPLASNVKETVGILRQASDVIVKSEPVSETSGTVSATSKPTSVIDRIADSARSAVDNLRSGDFAGFAGDVVDAGIAIGPRAADFLGAPAFGAAANIARAVGNTLPADFVTAMNSFFGTGSPLAGTGAAPSTDAGVGADTTADTVGSSVPTSVALSPADLADMMRAPRAPSPFAVSPSPTLSSAPVTVATPWPTESPFAATPTRAPNGSVPVQFNNLTGVLGNLANFGSRIAGTGNQTAQQPKTKSVENTPTAAKATPATPTSASWWQKILDPKLGVRTLSVTIDGQQTPIVLTVDVVEKIGQGLEASGGVYRAEVRDGSASVPRQLALKFYSGSVPPEAIRGVSMRLTLEKYGFPTLSFYAIDEGSNVVVSEYLNTPDLVALSKDNFSALVAKKSLDIPRDAFGNIATQLIATEKQAMDRGIWIPADSYFLMVNPKTGVPESFIIGDITFIQNADTSTIRPAYAESFLKSFIGQWLRPDIDPAPYYQDIAVRLNSSASTVASAPAPSTAQAPAAPLARNTIAPQSVAINADGEAIVAASTRAGHGVARNGIDNNEDAIQTFSISDAVGNRLSATVLGDGAGGVGVDPARASEIVVRHVSDALRALPANASVEAVQDAIKDGVANARTEFDADNVGEVSTLAVGIILEKPGQQIQAIAANLGDSPVMLQKADGSISRLTADHGELYKAARSGAMTIAKYNAVQDVIDRATSMEQIRQLATDAGLNPDSVEFFFSIRNTISGYVGRSRESEENEAEGFITEPEMHVLTLGAGDSLLVMSDGVSDVLTTGHMEAAMKAAASREAAADLLGSLARYASGEFIRLTASLSMDVDDIKNSIGPAAEALAANLKMARSSMRSKPDDVSVAVMAPSPGGIARATPARPVQQAAATPRIAEAPAPPAPTPRSAPSPQQAQQPVPAFGAVRAFWKDLTNRSPRSVPGTLYGNGYQIRILEATFLGSGGNAVVWGIDGIVVGKGSPHFTNGERVQVAYKEFIGGGINDAQERSITAQEMGLKVNPVYDLVEMPGGRSALLETNLNLGGKVALPGNFSDPKDTGEYQVIRSITNFDEFLKGYFSQAVIAATPNPKIFGAGAGVTIHEETPFFITARGGGDVTLDFVLDDFSKAADGAEGFDALVQANVRSLKSALNGFLQKSMTDPDRYQQYVARIDVESDRAIAEARSARPILATPVSTTPPAAAQETEPTIPILGGVVRDTVEQVAAMLGVKPDAATPTDLAEAEQLANERMMTLLDTRQKAYEDAWKQLSSEQREVVGDKFENESDASLTNAQQDAIDAYHAADVAVQRGMQSVLSVETKAEIQVATEAIVARPGVSGPGVRAAAAALDFGAAGAQELSVRAAELGRAQRLRQRLTSGDVFGDLSILRELATEADLNASQLTSELGQQFDEKTADSIKYFERSRDALNLAVSEAEEQLVKAGKLTSIAARPAADEGPTAETSEPAASTAEAPSLGAATAMQQLAAFIKNKGKALNDTLSENPLTAGAQTNANPLLGVARLLYRAITSQSLATNETTQVSEAPPTVQPGSTRLYQRYLSQSRFERPDGSVFRLDTVIESDSSGLPTVRMTTVEEKAGAVPENYVMPVYPLVTVSFGNLTGVSSLLNGALVGGTIAAATILQSDRLPASVENPPALAAAEQPSGLVANRPALIAQRISNWLNGTPQTTVNPTPEIVREAISRAITPIGYFGTTPLGGQNERQLQNRQDAWRTYLGLSQQNGTLSPSNFKPSQSNNPNAQYYKINNFIENLVNYARNGGEDLTLQQRRLRGEDQTDALRKPDFASTDAVQYLVGVAQYLETQRREMNFFGSSVVDEFGFVMGRFNVFVGQDARGSYISYYDRWDLKGSVEGKNGLIGTPFEIYDRIYYNPVTFEPVQNVNLAQIAPDTALADSGTLGVGAAEPSASPVARGLSILRATMNPLAVTGPQVLAQQLAEWAQGKSIPEMASNIWSGVGNALAPLSPISPAASQPAQQPSTNADANIVTSDAVQKYFDEKNSAVQRATNGRVQLEYKASSFSTGIFSLTVERSSLLNYLQTVDTTAAIVEALGQDFWAKLPPTTISFDRDEAEGEASVSEGRGSINITPSGNDPAYTLSIVLHEIGHIVAGNGRNTISIRSPHAFGTTDMLVSPQELAFARDVFNVHDESGVTNTQARFFRMTTEDRRIAEEILGRKYGLTNVNELAAEAFTRLFTAYDQLEGEAVADNRGFAGQVFHGMLDIVQQNTVFSADDVARFSHNLAHVAAGAIERGSQREALASEISKSAAATPSNAPTFSRNQLNLSFGVLNPIAAWRYMFSRLPARETAQAPTPQAPTVITQAESRFYMGEPIADVLARGQGSGVFGSLSVGGVTRAVFVGTLNLGTNIALGTWETAKYAVSSPQQAARSLINGTVAFIIGASSPAQSTEKNLADLTTANQQTIGATVNTGPTSPLSLSVTPTAGTQFPGRIGNLGGPTDQAASAFAYPTFAIGDSLIEGVQGADPTFKQGVNSVALRGQAPRAILTEVTNNAAKEAGQHVLISTGATNNTGQIDQYVPLQLAALKNAGARSVTVMGVGASTAMNGVNAKLDAAVKKFAADNPGFNVRFQGSLDAAKLIGDKEHLNAQGNKDFVASLRTNQAARTPPSADKATLIASPWPIQPGRGAESKRGVANINLHGIKATPPGPTVPKGNWVYQNLQDLINNKNCSDKLHTCFISPEANVTAVGRKLNEQPDYANVNTVDGIIYDKWVGVTKNDNAERAGAGYSVIGNIGQRAKQHAIATAKGMATILGRPDFTATTPFDKTDPTYVAAFVVAEAYEEYGSLKAQSNFPYTREQIYRGLAAVPAIGPEKALAWYHGDTIPASRQNLAERKANPQEKVAKPKGTTKVANLARDVRNKAKVAAKVRLDKAKSTYSSITDPIYQRLFVDVFKVQPPSSYQRMPDLVKWLRSPDPQTAAITKAILEGRTGVHIDSGGWLVVPEEVRQALLKIGIEFVKEEWVDRPYKGKTRESLGRSTKYFVQHEFRNNPATKDLDGTITSHKNATGFRKGIYVDFYMSEPVETLSNGQKGVKVKQIKPTGEYSSHAGTELNNGIGAEHAKNAGDVFDAQGFLADIVLADAIKAKYPNIQIVAHGPTSPSEANRDEGVAVADFLNIREKRLPAPNPAADLTKFAVAVNAAPPKRSVADAEVVAKEAKAKLVAEEAARKAKEEAEKAKVADSGIKGRLKEVADKLSKERKQEAAPTDVHKTASIAKPTVQSPIRTTVASVYAPEKTAWGREYPNSSVVGVAHKTLPRHTLVRITIIDPAYPNLKGRTLDTRVIDRGPYISGRDIDLTHGAAAALGLPRLSTPRITYQVIEGPQLPGNVAEKARKNETVKKAVAAAKNVAKPRFARAAEKPAPVTVEPTVPTIVSVSAFLRGKGIAFREVVLDNNVVVVILVDGTRMPVTETTPARASIPIEEPVLTVGGLRQYYRLSNDVGIGYFLQAVDANTRPNHLSDSRKIELKTYAAFVGALKDYYAENPNYPAPPITETNDMGLRSYPSPHKSAKAIDMRVTDWTPWALALKKHLNNHGLATPHPLKHGTGLHLHAQLNDPKPADLANLTIRQGSPPQYALVNPKTNQTIASFTSRDLASRPIFVLAGTQVNPGASNTPWTDFAKTLKLDKAWNSIASLWRSAPAPQQPAPAPIPPATVQTPEKLTVEGLLKVIGDPKPEDIKKLTPAEEAARKKGIEELLKLVQMKAPADLKTPAAQKTISDAKAIEEKLQAPAPVAAEPSWTDWLKAQWAKLASAPTPTRLGGPVQETPGATTPSSLVVTAEEIKASKVAAGDVKALWRALKKLNDVHDEAEKAGQKARAASTLAAADTASYKLKLVINQEAVLAKHARLSLEDRGALTKEMKNVASARAEAVRIRNDLVNAGARDADREAQAREAGKKAEAASGRFNEIATAAINRAAEKVAAEDKVLQAQLAEERRKQREELMAKLADISVDDSGKLFFAKRRMSYALLALQGHYSDPGYLAAETTGRLPARPLNEPSIPMGAYRNLFLLSQSQVKNFEMDMTRIKIALNKLDNKGVLDSDGKALEATLVQQQANLDALEKARVDDNEAYMQGYAARDPGLTKPDLQKLVNETDGFFKNDQKLLNLAREYDPEGSTPNLASIASDQNAGARLEVIGDWRKIDLTDDRLTPFEVGRLVSAHLNDQLLKGVETGKYALGKPGAIGSDAKLPTVTRQPTPRFQMSSIFGRLFSRVGTVAPVPTPQPAPTPVPEAKSNNKTSAISQSSPQPSIPTPAAVNPQTFVDALQKAGTDMQNAGNNLSAVRSAMARGSAAIDGLINRGDTALAEEVATDETKTELAQAMARVIITGAAMEQQLADFSQLPKVCLFCARSQNSEKEKLTAYLTAEGKRLYTDANQTVKLINDVAMQKVAAATKAAQPTKASVAPTIAGPADVAAPTAATDGNTAGIIGGTGAVGIGGLALWRYGGKMLAVLKTGARNALGLVRGVPASLSRSSRATAPLPSPIPVPTPIIVSEGKATPPVMQGATRAETNVSKTNTRNVATTSPIGAARASWIRAKQIAALGAFGFLTYILAVDPQSDIAKKLKGAANSPATKPAAPGSGTTKTPGTVPDVKEPPKDLGTKAPPGPGTPGGDPGAVGGKDGSSSNGGGSAGGLGDMLGSLMKALGPILPQLYNYLFGPQVPETPKAPKPSFSLTAAPHTVGAGETSKLSWTSKNTVSCGIYGPGSAQLAGGLTGSASTTALTRSTEFGIICDGEDGSRRSATLTVKVAGDTGSPIPVVFPTNPQSVSGPGFSGSAPVGGSNPSGAGGGVGGAQGQAGAPTNEAPVTPPISGHDETGKQVSPYCSPSLPMDAFVDCLCRLDPQGCEPWKTRFR